MSTNPVAAAPYVSTGQLPPSERVGLLVNAAYQRFRDNRDGELSGVYPSLALTLTGSVFVWRTPKVSLLLRAMQTSSSRS
jgi:hypothetical protein